MKRKQKNSTRKNGSVRIGTLTVMGILLLGGVNLIVALSTSNMSNPVIIEETIQMKEETSQSYSQEPSVTEITTVAIENLPEYAIDFSNIPFHPARVAQLTKIPQLDIPYYNQNDPRWAERAYGTDGSMQLWENGCAIVVLAMIEAYYNNGQTTPIDIVNWAGNQYYLHNQGSSWNIFTAFEERGFETTDLGNNLDLVKEELRQGKPVVVSVKAGRFTRTGHLMVIRGYQNGMFYINDPNDSNEKNHSIQGIPESDFYAEGINYWSIESV